MPGRAPVLFLIFNRPEPTRQVFEAIRAYEPSRLYVAADGPRPEKPGEWSVCADARSVLEQVDWKCEVHTLFRDQNLGCGTAVSEAISWFFGQEEEGIILEDDCLPDPSFFAFCEEMLARYRDQPKIGSISGDNFLPGSLHMEQPYGFSKYVQIWGWATWRRFWNDYDFKLTGDWKEWDQIIRQANPVENQVRYWFQIYKTLRAGLIDTWDYQVLFSSWRHGYIHIFPNRNLVTNLGYGGDATHTNFHSPLANLQRTSIQDYQVTLPVKIDPDIDNAIFYFRFLESLTSVWWLEQAMDLPGTLGWARSQLTLAQKENVRLKAIQQAQSREMAKIFAVRSKSAIRVNYVLLLAHFVYTCRRALDLARSKGNLIIAQLGSTLVRSVRRVSVRAMFHSVRQAWVRKTSGNRMIPRNERAALPARKEETISDDRSRK